MFNRPAPSGMAKAVAECDGGCLTGASACPLDEVAVGFWLFARSASLAAGDRPAARCLPQDRDVASQDEGARDRILRHDVQPLRDVARAWQTDQAETAAKRMQPSP